MDCPIVINVKYELSDFLKFNFWHIKKLSRGFAFFIGLWLFFTLVMLFVLSYEDGIIYGLSALFNQHIWMTSLLVIFLILIGFLYLNIINLGRRMVKENKIWSEEKEITIDNNGISSVSESSSLAVGWRDIVSYGVTKDLIVFYYTSSTSVLIPKRFAGNTETMIIDIAKMNKIKKRK